MSAVVGFHHITACAAGAQEDIDFFTKVLGQRLIKQSVLFDGRFAVYHLYYANGRAEIGSVMTTFPFHDKRGRLGSGQIQATAYTVSKDTLAFWAAHLDRHGVGHNGIEERFGERFIRLRHPSGLLFEVIENANDRRQAWTTKQIGADVGIRGFYGPVLSVRETEETERFFVEALGFRKTGAEGPYHRFEVGAGGAPRTIVLHHEPDRKQGSWGFGAGTGHHIALEVPNDDDLTRQKALYDELGYTDCSEIKDRNYFHSIYCRCPGGILVECAATAEGGFARDEPADALGTSLLLPPWFEHQRESIIGMLEPIRVPEENLALAGDRRATPAAAPAAGSTASRRADAAFLGGVRGDE
jgi:glyoxalase family protein